MPKLNCNNKDKSIKINGFDNQNNMLLKQINGVDKNCVGMVCRCSKYSMLM